MQAARVSLQFVNRKSDVTLECTTALACCLKVLAYRRRQTHTNGTQVKRSTLSVCVCLCLCMNVYNIFVPFDDDKSRKNRKKYGKSWKVMKITAV